MDFRHALENGKQSGGQRSSVGSSIRLRVLQPYAHISDTRPIEHGHIQTEIMVRLLSHRNCDTDDLQDKRGRKTLDVKCSCFEEVFYR